MLKVPTLLRLLMCMAGLLLAVPVLALLAFAFGIPLTLSGGFYLLGGFLFAMGLILAPWKPRTHLMLVSSGLIVILVVASLRIGGTRNTASNLRVILLPSGRSTRVVNTLIDERDALLFGEGMLRLIGGVSPREHEGLIQAVVTAYQEAGITHGVFPSPVLSTYLGLQKPSAFDALVIEPTVAQPGLTGIVFLHGYMGNVTLQCWEIARAVERINAITVCPSTDWIGDWWQPDGEAIVRASLRYLRERGVQRIYLGGFSNGGHGVGSLASSLASEGDIEGLFFIAGVRNAADVRGTGLPVLVIQGKNDDRIPVEAARQFVREVGEQITYVELEADHFLILKQHQQVQEALGTWLEAQEADN